MNPVIVGGVLVVVGHLAHALVAYLSAPKSSPDSGDPLSGLPGLPGHPLLNRLKAEWDAKQSAAAQEAEKALLAEVLKGILGK